MGKFSLKYNLPLDLENQYKYYSKSFYNNNLNIKSVSDWNKNINSSTYKLGFNEDIYKDQLITINDTKNKNCNNQFFQCNLNDFPNNSLNMNNEVKLSTYNEKIQIYTNLNIAPANKQRKKVKFIIINKKRFRTPKNTKENKMVGKNLSRKFCDYNIITKIKNHYLIFIINFINEIIKQKLEKIGSSKLICWEMIFKFFPLDGAIRRNPTKKLMGKIKEQTIEEFLNNNISKKFKKEKNSLKNKEICNNIKKEENLKDIVYILETKLLFFFEKIYFKKRREIYNLKDFGFEELEIKLPKTLEFYEDLVEKNKNTAHFDTYETKMNLCCKKYFFLGPKFKIENKQIKK